MTTPEKQAREALTDLADTFERFLGDIGHPQDSWQRDQIERARAAIDAIRQHDEAGAQSGGVLPTQRQMNEAFYVDVCRAEDRMKEFIKAGRTLLDSLPAHWHGEAESELRDLCDETDAVLNPHMHTPYQVEQASKRYGGSTLTPQPEGEAKAVAGERSAANIGWDIAAKYLKGGPGIRLAREITDAITAARTTPPPPVVDERRITAGIVLLHSLANDITEHNYADKRLYILQECVRLMDAVSGATNG
jgi:hypothetical protein